MPEPIVRTARANESTVFALRDFVVDQDAEQLLTADIDHIEIKVFDLHSAEPEVPDYQDLDVAPTDLNPDGTLIFSDVLINGTTDPAWTTNSVGFNLKVMVLAGPLLATGFNTWFDSRGGHTYKIEIVIKHKSLGDFPVLWRVQIKPRSSA